MQTTISQFWIWLVGLGGLCLIFLVLSKVYEFFRKVSDINKQTGKIDSLNSKMDLQNTILQEISLTLKSIESGRDIQDEKMWEFLMERAKTATLLRKFGEMNSPLILNHDVRVLFAPFEDKLHAYYRKEGHNLPDWKLYREISHLFKNELQDNICMVLNTTDGECAFMAAAVAKEGYEENGTNSPSVFESRNSD